MPVGWGITCKDKSMSIEPPYPILAQDRVRFVGELVACVIAESKMAARDAAELIDIEYRSLPAITNTAESVEEIVRTGGNLTAIPGVGSGIAGAVREIVERGGLRQLEELRTRAGEQAASLSDYPMLDPKRVERIYRKLRISTIEELKASLEAGDIGRQMGARMEHHVRQALTPAAEVLLYEADRMVPAIEAFLTGQCGAARAKAAGDYRRRVEVVRELTFVVETDDFDGVVDAFRRYGGRIALTRGGDGSAEFQHPSGMRIRLCGTVERHWGLMLAAATGSERHLAKLARAGHDLTALARGRASFRTEVAVYRKLGLEPIPPELREGHDEVERASR